MPSGDDFDEQPIRPPNFFGAYDPKELEALLEHHRTHFGDHDDEDDCSKNDGSPVQGLGGLHELILNTLQEPPVDGSNSEDAA
jgi:hypothetical protein